MSMPNPGDLTSWSVTNQVEQTQVIGGSPVKGVSVYYTTGAGHQGSVFVPYSQYTTDKVRAAVQAAAAQMDAIGMLSQGQPGS